jgi:hypothetical protein
MATNKSAGSDGFNADFYQKNWELVKDDLFLVLEYFHDGNLGIAGMNCRIIALIPVGKKADKIQKYIPICLLM